MWSNIMVCGMPLQQHSPMHLERGNMLMGSIQEVFPALLISYQD